MVMDSSVGAGTVMIKGALVTSSNDAVIEAVPVATPETKPFVLTVAIAVSEECHVVM